MSQADLFAEPLLEQLHAMDLAPFRFHGWTGNRKTQSYGWRYDFDDASFQPTEPISTMARAAA